MRRDHGNELRTKLVRFAMEQYIDTTSGSTPTRLDHHLSGAYSTEEEDADYIARVLEEEAAANTTQQQQQLWEEEYAQMEQQEEDELLHLAMQSLTLAQLPCPLCATQHGGGVLLQLLSSSASSPVVRCSHCQCTAPAGMSLSQVSAKLSHALQTHSSQCSARPAIKASPSWVLHCAVCGAHEAVM